MLALRCLRVVVAQLQRPSQFLTKHYSVAVKRPNAKLPHAPRLACQWLCETNSGLLVLGVKRIHICKRDIPVVGMVTEILGRNSISAFTQHDSEASARQERPAWCLEI